MTRAVRIVFAKELLENLRDRRVILSAFLFGVLLAPVIFGLTTSLASKRVVESQDKPLRLTVSGIEHAPNLVHFLEENGTEIKTVTMTADEAMSAVRSSLKSPRMRPSATPKIGVIRGATTLAPMSVASLLMMRAKPAISSESPRRT